MLPLQIKRHAANDVDPKQLLRAHVEKLPVEKQLEFVDAALELMGRRPYSIKTSDMTKTRLLS